MRGWKRQAHAVTVLGEGRRGDMTCTQNEQKFLG